MSQVKDPICGMLLTEEEIVVAFVYFGKTYAFCCVECYDSIGKTGCVRR